MGNAYEIFALRYATMSQRTLHLNFLVPDPHETTAQDLDYFVWLIRGHGREILVDTGCFLRPRLNCCLCRVLDLGGLFLQCGDQAGTVELGDVVVEAGLPPALDR